MLEFCGKRLVFNGSKISIFSKYLLSCNKTLFGISFDYFVKKKAKFKLHTLTKKINHFKFENGYSLIL